MVNVDEKVGLTEFQYMMKPDIDSFQDLLQTYTEAGMKDNILKLLSDSPQTSDNLEVNKYSYLCAGFFYAFCAKLIFHIIIKLPAYKKEY